MREDLVRWQWSHYGDNHRLRLTLWAHLVTVPLFMASNVALLAAPFVGGTLALGGLIGMVAALAVQGRTHRLEATAPIPFRGPLDALSRIVVEQWVTFPRYVASGGLARALEAAARSGAGSASS